jgi:hypothetical protein
MPSSVNSVEQGLVILPVLDLDFADGIDADRLGLVKGIVFVPYRIGKEIGYRDEGTDIHL